ncbi:Cro/Cl family transcriptional regulator [Grimontia kaedaensis]|uniref:Cro/Cl family transcriptional regulator n=1 Tax=Grimontia kaedaensis TaxID=2872157 RepID=A0ABY4WXG7_9GAMM|nr:Cro/CI family transcriptional regulator [Grimontia kaedaensis]USH03674.1 Cro/Cl family transcriptional regulator [Grimontia kaedaensis]
MNDELYDLLLAHFGTQQSIANTFGVSRPAVAGWKYHVPERVALLCHLSQNISYTYDPSHFQRDKKALKLNCVKPTALPQDSEVTTNDQHVHSEAA